jgi:hypothetical protein
MRERLAEAPALLVTSIDAPRFTHAAPDTD